MGQHYTRGTVSASGWCPKCRKQTQHRIDDRRMGPCLECIDRLADQAPAAVAEAAPQPGLFDGLEQVG